MSKSRLTYFYRLNLINYFIRIDLYLIKLIGTIMTSSCNSDYKLTQTNDGQLPVTTGDVKKNVDSLIKKNEEAIIKLIKDISYCNASGAWKIMPSSDINKLRERISACDLTGVQQIGLYKINSIEKVFQSLELWKPEQVVRAALVEALTIDSVKELSISNS